MLKPHKRQMVNKLLRNLSPCQCVTGVHNKHLTV